MRYFTHQASPAPPGRIALTVDVEDWFHLCGLPTAPAVPRASWRVAENVERILALLERQGARATFFILGSVAEALPTLVPSIAAGGHEIASHGYSHRLVTELTPALFRQELAETHAILRDQSGQEPIGFRAPQWSLSRERTPWAYEIMQELGYRYDSSSNPLPLVGDRQGDRLPHRITAGSGTLWEIPPLVTATPWGNLPTGGGWGFRFFPWLLIKWTVAEMHRRGAAAHFYLHPREVDPTGPRLRLSALKTFASYGTRRDALPRLEELLARYRCTTLRELVTEWESA